MKLRLTVLLVGLLIAQGVFTQTFSPMNSLLNGTSSNGEPCIMDMNGDYLDDVVRYTGGNIIIDFQQPDGTFQLQTFPAGISNYPTWSVAGGDLDKNGFNDLIFGSGSEVSFVYANADGTGYYEVNIPEYIFSQRTNMADIDNDGNLDAFACHDVDESHPYRNDGTGAMTEDQSLIQTVPLAGNYASVWCDFDNDGDTDMYLTKCRQGSSTGAVERENALYVNDGNGNYTQDVANTYGLFDNEQGWVTIFEDFDNDGDFDTYTVNHTASNYLRENDGAGHYTEITAGSGIDGSDLDSWACIGADFDNDGYVDILTQSYADKEYYHNDGNMNFTPSSMPFSDGALGDLNNDGFLDIFTGNTVYMNDGNDNNWVKFTLQGILSNLNGIGARLSIYGDWGMQIRECRSGQSFAPMSTLNVHFGIGEHTSIDSAVVSWPSGVQTTLYDLDINQQHLIPEASCTFNAEPVTTSGPTTICAGDAVTLLAPDGFSYDWSNGASEQNITVSEAGTYSVNMEDAGGCLSVSDFVVVSVITDETPSVTLQGEETFCEGGSVTLTSSVAAGYEWSNSEESQSIIVSETGEYTVTVEGVCGLATSETITITSLESALPSVSDVTVDGTGIQEITAGGELINWYGDAAGTDFLGQGNTLNLDVPGGGTTVYASNTSVYPGTVESGGKLTNDGGGGLPSTGAYSYFDVWEEFTLDEVTVYVINNMQGIRTFQLVDGDGTILEQEDYQLVNGENIVGLDWDVPVGEGLSLRCTQNDLFRNDSGVNYPYAIGSVGEIYDSFYGGNYYYYFYDWKVTKGQFECESELVGVDVSIATGIEELSSATDLEIYPNPVIDLVTVSLDVQSTTDLTVRLIDVLGAVIVENTFENLSRGEFKTVLDMASLSPGTYEIQLIDEQGTVSRPIVKR